MAWFVTLIVYYNLLQHYFLAAAAKSPPGLVPLITSTSIWLYPNFHSLPHVRDDCDSFGHTKRPTKGTSSHAVTHTTMLKHPPFSQQYNLCSLESRGSKCAPVLTPMCTIRATKYFSIIRLTMNERTASRQHPTTPIKFTR